MDAHPGIAVPCAVPARATAAHPSIAVPCAVPARATAAHPGSSGSGSGPPTHGAGYIAGGAGGNCFGTS